MIHIPKNIEHSDKVLYPYSLDDGISSSKEIYSIIPITNAKINPNKNSLIKGFNIK